MADTKRLLCRQRPDLRKWKGITQEQIDTLARVEQKMRRATQRDGIKRIHCNIFKGRSSSGPTI